MSTSLRRVPWAITILAGVLLGVLFAPYEVMKPFPASRWVILIFGAVATAVAASWRTRDITFAEVKSIHLLTVFGLLVGGLGLALNIAFSVQGYPVFSVYCLLCAAFMSFLSWARANETYS